MRGIVISLALFFCFTSAASAVTYNITQNISNGQVLSGSRTWRATATADGVVTDVGKVVFRVDYVKVHEDSTVPYTFRLHTKHFTNVEHVFSVRAVKQGTPLVENFRTATIDNGPGTGPMPSPIAGSGYNLTYEDTFNTLNSNVWGHGSIPNASITVSNSILNLISRRSQGYPDIALTTEAGAQDKTFTEGYIEARMRWTGGAGAWPAFKLMSYRHATNPAFPNINPFCADNGLPSVECLSAEIDVFEGQGRQPSAYYAFFHRNSCGCYGTPDELRPPADTFDDVSPIRLADNWHVYAIRWTDPTHISTWYLDDQFPVALEGPFDSTNQPLFLLLQMATGGPTGGTDSTTPDELRTQVDWVRVYQK